MDIVHFKRFQRQHHYPFELCFQTLILFNRTLKMAEGFRFGWLWNWKNLRACIIIASFTSDNYTKWSCYKQKLRIHERNKEKKLNMFSNNSNKNYSICVYLCWKIRIILSIMWWVHSVIADTGSKIMLFTVERMIMKWSLLIRWYQLLQQ